MLEPEDADRAALHLASKAAMLRADAECILRHAAPEGIEAMHAVADGYRQAADWLDSRAGQLRALRR